jgi:hypothetical protein
VLCLSVGISQTDDAKKKQSLCRQEARIELELLGSDAISLKDLITPSRRLTSLGHLYHSLVGSMVISDVSCSEPRDPQRWFIDQLNSLKSLSEEPISPGSGDPLEAPAARTPLTSHIPMMAPVLPTEPLKLPLTRAMAL